MHETLSCFPIFFYFSVILFSLLEVWRYSSLCGMIPTIVSSPLSYLALQHFKQAFRAFIFFLSYSLTLYLPYLVNLFCHIYYGLKIEKSCLVPICILLKMFYRVIINSLLYSSSGSRPCLFVHLSVSQSVNLSIHHYHLSAGGGRTREGQLFK